MRLEDRPLGLSKPSREPPAAKRESSRAERHPRPSTRVLPASLHSYVFPAAHPSAYRQSTSLGVHLLDQVIPAIESFRSRDEPSRAVERERCLGGVSALAIVKLFPHGRPQPCHPHVVRWTVPPDRALRAKVLDDALEGAWVTWSVGVNKISRERFISLHLPRRQHPAHLVLVDESPHSPLPA